MANEPEIGQLEQVEVEVVSSTALLCRHLNAFEFVSHRADCAVASTGSDGIPH